MTHRVVRLHPAPGVVTGTTGVASALSGGSTEERLEHLLPPDRIPADTPLVLLWRGDEVSSPDVLTVEACTRNGPHIRLQLELRRFEGPLHINTVTVPVVEVDLGVLAAGQYDVSIALTTLSFNTYDRPETAAGASTEHTGLSLTVA